MTPPWALVAQYAVASTMREREREREEEEEEEEEKSLFKAEEEEVLLTAYNK